MKTDCVIVTPRAIAFHEAAHAVFAFLVGDEFCQSQIRLAADFPRDTAALYFASSTCELQCQQFEHGKSEKCRCALRAIMILLAGPAAQQRIDNAQCQSEKISKDCDHLQSNKIAAVIAGSRAPEVVQMVRTWIDELIDTPRIWQTISTLAYKLKFGRKMDGRRACRIMRRQWAGSESPLTDLEPKWMRRLGAATLNNKHIFSAA